MRILGDALFIFLKSAMLNCAFAIWLLGAVITEGIGGCSVDRIDQAAVDGDDISVTCSAGDALKVFQWRFEGEIVFRSAYYDYSTGNLSFVNAYLKVGYFMDDIGNPVLKKSTLTIKKVNHSNAGAYSCECADKSSITPVASVISNIIIVSTPKFSTTSDLRDGEPINFICNVSFSGIADSSIAIEDFMGSDFIAGNQTANLKGLHIFALNYNVISNSSIEQKYWCNVTLTNDSSNAQIYSTKLEASVQWTPVQNVQIIPSDNCINGSQCATNEVVVCSADGNPKPTDFNWTMSINGSEPTVVGGNRLTLTTIGQHTIQCTAVNFIKNVRYQNISDTFTTQVTVDGPKTEASQQSETQRRNALIIGLVVGLGGGIILVIIIVVLVLFKRKRSQTGCCNVEEHKGTGGNETDAAMELSKSNGLKSNSHTTPGDHNKGFEKNANDEVTLVENHLYSGAQKAKQIDPSDGGYASINEVMPHGK